MKKEDIIVPVSSGELIDKLAILKIKKKKIFNKSKLQNINNELWKNYKIFFDKCNSVKKLSLKKLEKLKE